VFVVTHDDAYLDPTLSMDDILADILNKTGVALQFQVQQSPPPQHSRRSGARGRLHGQQFIHARGRGYVYQFTVGSDGYAALASVAPGTWRLHQAEFDVMLNSLCYGLEFDLTRFDLRALSW
jgi:hypothetical protein